MAKEEETPQPAEKPESETPAEQGAAFEQPESETPSEKEVSAEKVESETPAEKEVSAEQKVEAEEPEVVEKEKTGKELNKDARMWAMICHLGGLGGLIPVVPVIGSVIAPLIIWQVKKDEDPFIDEQGKEALNFQISILIYALVSGLLCFACVGFVLLPAVYIFDLIFLLIAAVKANDGHHYRYPLTIRFVK
jgi:uncharacterized Tic20 family protein